MINCPKCQLALEEGVKYCSRCGLNIEREYLIDPICPRCEKQYPNGTRFCDTDGSALTTKDKLIPKCVKCGKSYPKGVRYCTEDGGEVVPEALRQSVFGVDSSALDFGKKLKTEDIEHLITRDYKVKIKEYFSKGWALYKSNIGSFIGFSIVYILIYLLLSAIPVAGPLISWVIATPLSAGFYFAAFALINGQQIEFKVFFKGFNLLLPLFLAGLLTGIFTTIGYVLLILPGIYLTVAYIFTTPLIVDKKMEFWQAMETSRKMITRHWFSFFLLCCALLALNVAGALALLVGLLFTVPLTYCILAYAYNDIVEFKNEWN